MSKRQRHPLFNTDEPEEDFSRNVWGWKFSIFSLILIVFMSGLMAYRHFVRGENIFTIEKTEVQIGIDTIEQ